MSKTIMAVVIGLLLIVLVLAGPLFVIWAWNTLFGTVHLIPYTFWTWLATLVLGVFIRSDVKVKR